jgi:hypothetical protein
MSYISSTDRAFRYQYTNPSIPSGNTVTSSLVTNSETSFTSSAIIPASAFNTGAIVHIEASGLYSTGVVSLPLTVKVKSGSMVLASSSFTPVLNLTNQGWEMDLTCNVFDLSTVEIQGTAMFGTMTTVNNTASFSVNMSNDVPVSISATWGSLAVGGSIQLRILAVQVS